MLFALKRNQNFPNYKRKNNNKVYMFYSNLKEIIIIQFIQVTTFPGSELPTFQSFSLSCSTWLSCSVTPDTIMFHTDLAMAWPSNFCLSSCIVARVWRLYFVAEESQLVTACAGGSSWLIKSYNLNSVTSPTLFSGPQLTRSWCRGIILVRPRGL